QAIEFDGSDRAYPDRRPGIPGESHELVPCDIVHHAADFPEIPRAARPGVRARQNSMDYFVESRIRLIACVEFHQPRGALRIEQKLQRVLGRSLCRGQRVERGTRANLEVFAAARVT